MATRAGDFTGGLPQVSALPTRRQAAAPSSQRELRPGLVLAFVYAWGLAMARLIDVSDDGKAMLLFGISFSMVAILAALVRPRWYLPLVVAYLPFSKVYPLPLFGIAGANMTNLLLALGPIAWISDRIQRRPRLRLGFVEALVFFFVAASVLSVVPAYTANPEFGEIAQTYRAWFAPLFFFFLARGLVRNREDVAGVLQVLAWTAFLAGAITWREGLDRSSRGTIEQARVPGLMEQPNAMGAFLVYYGVPLLACAVTARDWRKGWPYLFAFLITARATLYTFSRAAYLALAGGSVTVLLFGNPLLLAAAGGGGVVSLVLFPTLMPESVRERLSETTSERSTYEGENPTTSLDRSSAHRLVLWRGAVRMIGDHPLVGVGLGRFQEMIGFYTEYPLRRSDPHDAHNAYLLQAAEMGLPSLGLLLLLFLTWGSTALRLFLRRHHPLDRRLALAFLGSLAGVLVSCLLGSRFSDEALVGWFWILAALVVVVSRLREPRRAPRRAA